MTALISSGFLTDLSRCHPPKMPRMFAKVLNRHYARDSTFITLRIEAIWLYIPLAIGVSFFQKDAYSSVILYLRFAMI
jgi:hypothetical protein